MEITHIEHIGIAVKNIEESIKYYESILGLKCYSIEEIKDQKVRTAFFMVGQTKIELLESTDSEGPISKHIEKKGQGLHHIAFAVKDINKSLSELKAKDISLIDEQARQGAEGCMISFIHPKSSDNVLTELCQISKEY